MNKIRLISSLIIVVALGLLSSCNKNNKDDAAPSGTGNTDFQVYVTNSNNQLIDSAVVSLYASLSDRDAGTNLINYYNSLGTNNLLNYVSNGRGITVFANTLLKRSFARVGVSYGYSISNIQTLTTASTTYFNYINFQGVQAVAHSDAMPGATIRSELAFKRFNLLAEDVPTRFHNSAIGRVELALQLQVGSFQV